MRQCYECGLAISKERLEAVPGVQVCRRCQEVLGDVTTVTAGEARATFDTLEAIPDLEEIGSRDYYPALVDGVYAPRDAANPNPIGTVPWGSLL